MAAPTEEVIQACLTTEEVPGKVRYRDLNFEDLTIEDHQGRALTVTTVQIGTKAIGKYEYSASKSFGIVYGNTKIPASKIKPLTSARPEAFQVELAVFGEATRSRSRFLCITFNFEGLGQSGTFQNVRGLYLIETSAKPVRVYYTVGDIRKYRQPSR